MSDQATDEFRTSVRRDLDANPYSRTTTIHFELSNRCNLASKHSNCPLGPTYAAEQKAGVMGYKDYLCKGQYLSPTAIQRCLSDLGAHSFDGEVYFHRYNDPLIELDKLNGLVAFARGACPHAHIVVYTNAVPLTLEIANELVQLGATRFVVSAYQKQMASRVQKIFKNMSRQSTSDRLQVESIMLERTSTDSTDVWGNQSLDDRITLYDRAAQGQIRKNRGPCFAPLNDITISHSGKVVLCCLDYRDSQEFGSIYESELSEILRSDSVLSLYCDLSRNVRTLPICRACGWSR